MDIRTTYPMVDPRTEHCWPLRRPARGPGWRRGPSRGRSNGLWSWWRVNVADNVRRSDARRNRLIAAVHMTYIIYIILCYYINQLLVQVFRATIAGEEKVKKFHRMAIISWYPYYIIFSALGTDEFEFLYVYTYTICTTYLYNDARKNVGTCCSSAFGR